MYESYLYDVIMYYNIYYNYLSFLIYLYTRSQVAFAYGVASKRATKHAVEAPPSEAMELFIIRVHLLNYMFSMYVYMIIYMCVHVFTYAKLCVCIYIYMHVSDVFIYIYIHVIQYKFHKSKVTSCNVE